MRFKKEKTYLKIIDYILEQFTANNTAFTDAAYSEQQLMSILGVSRPTLREALRVLEFLDVTTVEPHNGITFHRPSADCYLSLLYLLEFEGATIDELQELHRALCTGAAVLVSPCRADLPEFAEHHTGDILSVREGSMTGNTLFQKLISTIALSIEQKTNPHIP